MKKSYKELHYTQIIIAICLFIVLVLLPIAGCSSNKHTEQSMAESHKSKGTVTTTPVITEIPTPTKTPSPTKILPSPTPAPSSIHLMAAGDNLIHSQVINSGKQSDGSLNYDQLYSHIKKTISSADIAVINQETILGGDEFAYSGYPNFNSPTEIGDAVVKAGFDVVLQATNHTLDKGYLGVANTLQFWKKKHPNITLLGINKTRKDYNKIKIIKKNGIKIAMLDYAYCFNGHVLPKDKPYLANLIDKSKMAKDIKKAEALADFTIVFPHWGTEYVYTASKQQKELTEFFYKHGVDLVIGSHPHVLEPVKWIQKKEGNPMLVYYSLGNFISCQRDTPRMLGGIANVTITKDSSGTYISDASIIPIVTHYESGPADYNYSIYKLRDYSEALAKKHSLSKTSASGSFTYKGLKCLAKKILGSWYKS